MLQCIYVLRTIIIKIYKEIIISVPNISWYQSHKCDSNTHSSMAVDISKNETTKFEIDMSSPYYLHLSDNPGMVLIACTLNGDNYATWMRAMQNALYAKNKYSLVDDTVSKPIAPAAEVNDRVKCNSMVISWLFNALHKDLHDSVAYMDTASELWTDLEDRFSQGNAPRVHQLK
jgi:predicted YcjX-like family ATPase